MRSEEPLYPPQIGVLPANVTISSSHSFKVQFGAFFINVNPMEATAAAGRIAEVDIVPFGL